MKDNYEDIMDMPYIKSEKYAHMSTYDRAAQFAPFSALTGYSDTVNEAGRRTDGRIELDEYEKELINRELQKALDHIEESPVATLTYFVPDTRKSGGEYITVKEEILEIDEYQKTIKLSSGKVVSIDELTSMMLEM